MDWSLDKIPLERYFKTEITTIGAMSAQNKVLTVHFVKCLAAFCALYAVRLLKALISSSST